MKNNMKKIYLILFLIASLTYNTKTLAKEDEIKYSRENISNYFSGIISVNYANSKNAFKHLNKVQSLKNNHSNYNIQFLRTLVLLDKFEQAFDFSESAWSEKELFFEADLLMGLNYFINGNYLKAEKHFKRLNKMTKYNIVFQAHFLYN